MEDVASFEQLEGQKELLTVGAHSLDVEPNIFTVFLQHLSQIHTTDEKDTGELVCEAITLQTLQTPVDAHISNDVNKGIAFPFSVPERLKYQTKMLLVVEVPEEAKAVELVIRICVI